MIVILVSVVMPVYNAERYVSKALDSILVQTYKNLEFIVIDDGSTDGSLAIIKEYQRRDARITIISRENRGVVHSLNEAIQVANGKYIARMDADDISVPHRIERQLAYMEANPEVGILGAWVELFGKKNEVWHHRREDNHIRNMLLFKSSGFAHSTVFARRSLMQRFPYEQQHAHVEDTACWIRMALHSDLKFANLPEVLVFYRVHDNQVSEVYKAIQDKSYRTIIAEYLTGLGVEFSSNDLALHLSVAELKEAKSFVEVKSVGEWLMKLKSQLENTLPDSYDLFQERWLSYCLKNIFIEGVDHFYFVPNFKKGNYSHIKEKVLHTSSLM